MGKDRGQFNKLLQFGSFDCDFWGLGNADEPIENWLQFDKKENPNQNKANKGTSRKFLKDKLQKIINSDFIVLQ